MIEMIDFTNCPLSSRNLQYAGRAGEKRGIVYKNDFWFLKFPKNTIGMDKIKTLSYVTSPLSEYIGSHIYEILGYDVHETILGVCFDGKRNKVVCACRDFIKDDRDQLLIPYTALRNDTSEAIMERNDSSLASASNLNEIIFQLEHNAVLSNIPNAKERFWDSVVVDILINNNDRNEDNWGVIKFKSSGKYEMSPVYDNGNSFYSKTDETRIESILGDKAKLISSATNGITAYEDDDESQISIVKMLKNENKDFIEAMKRVYSKVIACLDDIESFIKGIPNEFSGAFVVSENRKSYYIETFKIRLEMLEKALGANQ